MNATAPISDLLRQLRDDTTALVREEVSLAKTEAGEKAAKIGRNIAWIAAGALIASAALVLFLMSLAYLAASIITRSGMDPVMAGFLGFFIVSIVVGLAAGIWISSSLKAISKAPVVPEKTIQSLREDKQWAQSKMS